MHVNCMGVRNLVLWSNKMTAEDMDRYVDGTLRHESVGSIGTTKQQRLRLVQEIEDEAEVSTPPKRPATPILAF